MFNLRNFLYRNRRFRKMSEEFKRVVETEAVEEFLVLLLSLMSLTLFVDENYRKNIRKFRGKYLFKTKDKGISVRAVFGPHPIFRYDRLSVREGGLENPDLTVTFKNARALMNYLLSPRRDILGSLLRNEVTLSGNMNYIYKLGFMSSQLQQMVLPAS